MTETTHSSLRSEFSSAIEKINEEDLQDKDDISAQRPINNETRTLYQHNSPTNNISISEKMPQSFKPKVSVFQIDKNSRLPIPSKVDYEGFSLFFEPKLKTT